MFERIEGTLRLERTRKGLPAAWEYGGGMTNTGFAVIIANGDGTPKKPVYIRRSGDLACREHALFVVREGDLVIEAHHHRRDFQIYINRIKAIRNRRNSVPTKPDEDFESLARRCAEDYGEKFLRIIDVTDETDQMQRELLGKTKRVVYETDGLSAELEIIHSFYDGEWGDTEPEGPVMDAVNAAMEKATDYHCRVPYYYAVESAEAL